MLVCRSPNPTDVQLQAKVYLVDFRVTQNLDASQYAALIVAIAVWQAEKKVNKRNTCSGLPETILQQ